jgi:hypothetical protein
MIQRTQPKVAMRYSSNQGVKFANMNAEGVHNSSPGLTRVSAATLGNERIWNRNPERVAEGPDRPS